MTSLSQRIVLAVPLCGFLLASPAWARHPETGFLNRVTTVNGVQHKYQVFVPSTWNKKAKWPVILFLHGAGERNEDGLLQTEVGLGAAIRRHVDRFPFVVVFPQCRRDDWWTSPAMEALALKALDQSMKEFKGDPDSVYLTGISMRGYGTWFLGSKYASKFAALVPICGGILPPPNYPSVPASGDSYATVAQKIGKTPVWVFHGGADTVVPVTESRQMIDALKAAGGLVRYTEYEGVGHNSWDSAYAEIELLSWLRSQRRSAAR